MVVKEPPVYYFTLAPILTNVPQSEMALAQLTAVLQAWR